MSGRPPLSAEERDRLHATLDVFRETYPQHQNVPGWALEQIAAQFDRSIRTVQRLDLDRSPSERRELKLTRHMKAVIAASPCLTMAHRDLQHRYPRIGSYSRLWRAVQKLGAGERATLTGRGERDLRNLNIYIGYDVEASNDINTMDHHYLDLYVRPEGSTRIDRPWVTSVHDMRSRLIKHVHHYFGAADATVSVACAAASMLTAVWDGEVVHLGRPQQFRHDNGSDLTAEYMDEFRTKMRTVGVTNVAYNPPQNGIHERWHLTLKNEIAARYPGTTTGPTGHHHVGATQHPFVPRDPNDVLTSAELTERLLRHQLLHNTRWRPDTLDGHTPLEVWRKDSHLIEPVSREEVARAMFRTARKIKIEKKGVRSTEVSDHWYVPTDLHGTTYRYPLPHYSPHRVQLAYTVYDDHFVEVLLDGKPVTRAVRKDLVTLDDRRQNLTSRRTELAAARRTQRDGAEMLQTRLQAERDTGDLDVPLSRGTLRPRKQHVDRDEALAFFSKGTSE